HFRYLHRMRCRDNADRRRSGDTKSLAGILMAGSIPASHTPAAANEQRRAFTLVEMLVTMTLIAILLAIALPVINRVRENAREADGAQRSVAVEDVNDELRGELVYGARRGRYRLSRPARQQGCRLRYHRP